MRDLIAKQTAALVASGRSVAMYNPDLLRGAGSTQEVLDAEDRGDQTASILKNILSTLKKSLIVQEEMQSSLEKLANSISKPMTSARVDSSVVPTAIRQSSTNTMNSLTFARETMLLKGPATPSAVPSKSVVPMLGYTPTVAQKDKSVEPSAAVSSEEKRETLALLEKQTTLLEGILAALGGKAEAKPAPKATKDDASAAGGLLSGGIKKMIPNLLKGFLKVGLVGMIAGLFSGVVDGIKEYAKSGDIMKALSAGLGGFLEFLTFGLFNKDDVERWLKGAKEIWNNLGTYVDEYLVQPFNSLVDTVGKALDEYVVQPLSNFIGTVSDLFKQYVMDPISGFLQNVTSVFSSITDSLVAFLNGFEIPKVSVNLPVVGEISAGPWKPFAGVANAIKGGEAKPTATPSTPAPTSGNAVAATSASNVAARDSMATQSAPVIVSAPSTNVQNKQNVTIPQPVRNPDMSFNRYMNKSRVIV